MRQFGGRLFKDTKGNILAISAAGTFALVGGAGLAVDAVNWYLWKRQLQQAVDSGSLAGAHAMHQGADVDASAHSDVEKNADTTVSVERVSVPPQSGAYSGNPGAVEVIASTTRELPFSSLFLATAPLIRVRAVATSVSEGEHCVVALAETGLGVNVTGSANVQLGCGVAANSAGSQSIYLEGSSYLSASPLNAVGGIVSSSSNTPSGTNFHPYGLAQDDPLSSRNLLVPTEPAACTASNFEAPPNQNITLSPGRYCGGLSLKGNVVMQPGVYLIDRGEFYVASNASVTAQGVTIILTGDGPSNIATTNIAGGADLDMRAPLATEDPYWKNILFFQDPQGTSNQSTIAGDSSMSIEGVIYMPNGPIRFAGSSGQHADCFLLVAHRVTLAGTTSLDNSCPADYSDLDLSTKRIRVVE